MVKLEQIRALEARVEKAVVLIDKLRKENAELEQRLLEAAGSQESLAAENVELRRKIDTLPAVDLSGKLAQAEAMYEAESIKSASLAERCAELEGRLAAAEAKASELEASAEEFRTEQLRIEEGLSHALSKLDAFEDMVMGISTPVAEAEGQKASGSAPASMEDDSPEAAAETQKDALPENELDIF
ncbi:MAG: hypothetical protein FD137_1369 [Spirochaetes bacterium]|nr:MAG: hypothetical protein FD137_1369 [Spirochaetota bacterium]